MNETSQQFKKQLPKNALMSALSFFTYALSAIWLTPYLVKNLGSAAYGLVPLAGLLTQYVTLITSQISVSINRFLTIELQKPDGKPNEIFNSAFVLYLSLALLQLPVFAAVIWYSDRIFSIPEELKVDTILLLLGSAGCFLISLMSGVFNISIFAKNRLDIGASVNVVRLILRLIFIVLLFVMNGPKLRYIGYVDFVLNLGTFIVAIYLWRKLTPNLSIRFRDAKWSVLKPVFHMSFWTLLTNFGSLLYLRSDIWILNKFVSPIVAGQYAAILVVANFIRQLASLFNGQLAPTIMNYWAVDDRVSLRRLLTFSVKTLSIGLAIPVGIICFNGNTILNLWLGPEFASLAMLLVVLSIHLPLTMGISPVHILHAASNTVRLPAWITLILGFVNVGLSFFLGVSMGWGALGVATATAITLIANDVLFAPMYAAYVLKQPRTVFLRPLTASAAMIGTVYALSYIPLAGLFGLDSSGLIGLGLQAGFVCGISLLIFWFVVVNKDEKKVVLSMLPPIFRCS